MQITRIDSIRKKNQKYVSETDWKAYFWVMDWSSRALNKFAR